MNQAPDKHSMPSPPPPGRKLAPWVSVLILIAALLYGVSPVDILPEAALGPLGLADDALVGLYALWRLVATLRSRA